MAWTPEIVVNLQRHRQVRVTSKVELTDLVTGRVVVGGGKEDHNGHKSLLVY